MHEGHQLGLRRSPKSPPRTASGSIGLPHSPATSSTFAPARRAMSAMRPPNTPFCTTIAVSPGSSSVTSAISMASEAGAESGKVTRFAVRNARRNCP